MYLFTSKDEKEKKYSFNKECCYFIYNFKENDKIDLNAFRKTLEKNSPQYFEQFLCGQKESNLIKTKESVDTYFENFKKGENYFMVAFKINDSIKNTREHLKNSEEMKGRLITATLYVPNKSPATYNMRELPTPLKKLKN